MTRFLFAASLALTLAACGDKDDDTAADGTGGTGGGDAANGETLYGSNCQACHGEAGLGEDGGGISGATNLTTISLSESAIVDVILNGSGGMSPVSVSQAEAEDIAAYVSGTFMN